MWVQALDFGMKLASYLKRAYSSVKILVKVLSNGEKIYKQSFPSSSTTDENTNDDEFIETEIGNIKRDINSVNKNIKLVEKFNRDNYAQLEHRLKFLSLIGSTRDYNRFISNIEMHMSSIKSNLAIMNSVIIVSNVHGNAIDKLIQNVNILQETLNLEIESVEELSSSDNTEIGIAISSSISCLKTSSRLIKEEIKIFKQNLKQDLGFVEILIESSGSSSIRNYAMKKWLKHEVKPNIIECKKEIDKLSKSFLPDMDAVFDEIENTSNKQLLKSV